MKGTIRPHRLAHCRCPPHARSSGDLPLSQAFIAASLSVACKTWLDTYDILEISPVATVPTPRALLAPSGGGRTRWSPAPTREAARRAPAAAGQRSLRLDEVAVRHLNRHVAGPAATAALQAAGARGCRVCSRSPEISSQFIIVDHLKCVADACRRAGLARGGRTTLSSRWPGGARPRRERGRSTP
jgi:hypothetical protein